MEPSDESLIAECARGGKEAFEELYRRYGGPIASYLCRCLGDVHEAEELCQETFARVWLRAAQCDVSRARFRAWLYQIATNLVRSRWRRARRSPIVSLPEPPETDREDASQAGSGDLPGSSLMKEQTARILEDAVKELKADHRIIIILKYFENMKIREIAPLVGCSEGTVKSRLHHALRSLGGELRNRGLCEEDAG